MFHPMFSASHSTHSECLQEMCDGAYQPDRQPSETYKIKLASPLKPQKRDEVWEDSHAICSVRQSIDDKLLVLFFPFPHAPVRIDNRLDVLDYVLLLPALLVKRNLERS